MSAETVNVRYMVNDVEAAVGWYTEHLGFELLSSQAPAFADVKNTSGRGQASPAYAAEFLKEFVGEGPWAHVDMAGPGYIRWPRPDYFPVPGGTGYGVRLIAELARSLT
jgi:leucyl aminopeptidase